MTDAICPGIVSNTDLVGIGTRLNFYFTIFLAAIIPRHRYTIKLFQELHMRAVLYVLALLMTVLVRTIKGQLDLYHAIFVMHMLVFFSVIQLDGINTSTLRHGYRLDMTYVVQCFGILVIFPSWALYVWIKGSVFGSQPLCNDLVKYVFFFISVQGTVHWLRILAIICFSVKILSSGTKLLSVFFLKKGKKQGDEVFSGNILLISPSISRLTSRLVSILIAVYCIVTTELIVHRNRSYVQAGENSWSHCQFVSALWLSPVFIELLNVLIEWYSRTNTRRRAEAREEGYNTI